MIYTPLTQKAMKMAYRAHHGQTDKGGIPYVFHCYHVAEQMTDEITTCAALLHDVLEDTMYKEKDLEEKFPQEVVDIVKLLTHGDGDYFAYVREIKKNPAAKAVKLADIEHNMDPDRMAAAGSITESQKRWYQEKYERARAILLDEA